jgi:Cyclin
MGDATTIKKITFIQKTCLLLILHYIDQICAREPTFTICSLTVHRFIIAAVSLSSKSHCDAFCTNAHYARVGGLAPSEVARLERAFLAAIDWRLACTREVLQLYYVNLVAHSGGRFYILSSSSSNEDVNDVTTNLPPSTTTTTTTTTAATATATATATAVAATATATTSGTPSEMFNQPPDRGMTSDGRGATASPAVVPAAGPPPPIGGPGMGTPAPSVEQNMAFAQFRQRHGGTQGDG